MKKSSEYLTKKLFLHFLLLFIVSILYGIISSIIQFYNTTYQPDLIKLFIRISILNGLLFYLPAFILSLFAYTVNSSFPDSIMEKNNITPDFIFSRSVIIFFFLFSFSIIFIGLLTQHITDLNDRLALKNKFLELRAQKYKLIENKFNMIDKLISKKEYYEALDLANDIIIIFPNNPTAEEKIKLLNELIREARIKKLKFLKKKGLKLFKEKKYLQSLKYFNSIININPTDKEAKKYITIIHNLLSLKEQKIIKDKYTSVIYFNEKNSPVIEYNKKIFALSEEGKELFRKKKYIEAKNKFKAVLKIDLNNYDARRYLMKITDKLAEINYFTNRENKLIKRNIFYNTEHNGYKYLFSIEELRKCIDNQFVLYNTVIYRFGKPNKIVKFKYGFLDLKKRKYVFLNSFFDIKIKKSYIDFIYPKILWIRENIVENPELFPLGEILKLKKFLQLNKKTFIKLIVIKVNYYILFLFLFLMLLPLSFYCRRKFSKTKFNFLTILFLPIFSYLIYKLYYILFFLLKNFINAGFSIEIKFGLFLNILFYVLVFLLFKILISLTKERYLKNNVKVKKVN